MKHIEELSYKMIEEARKTLSLFDIVTADEVKTAYRELAKKHHPDGNGDDSYDDREFKKINEAYQVLMNFINQYNYSLRKKDVGKQLLGTMDDFLDRFNTGDPEKSKGKN